MKGELAEPAPISFHVAHLLLCVRARESFFTGQTCRHTVKEALEVR